MTTAQNHTMPGEPVELAAGHWDDDGMEGMEPLPHGDTTKTSMQSRVEPPTPTSPREFPRISPDLPPSRSRSRNRVPYKEVGDIFLPEYQPRGCSTPRKARRKQKKTTMVEELAYGGKGRSIPAPRPGMVEGDWDATPRARLFTPQPGSNVASGNNSPMLRPASRAGGISVLRQQLEALDLERTPSQTSMVRSGSKLGSESPSTVADSVSDAGYDSDPTEMTSYDIEIEHDFVSAEAEQFETRDGAGAVAVTPFMDKVHRKMSAEDFEPLTCLGQGTFGTVHLVKQRSSGRLYAQKMFRKATLTVHKSMVEQTKTERAILESINRHPFVVKLFYAFQDHERLYLILEYAEGGELFTHLATEKMFPEPTAAFYLAELILALEHLHHTVGVVYRDLKPENCLLDADGHLLLTDFGLSKVAVDGTDTVRCSSILGTIDYMAPEVILGHFYGAAVDWWSLGALGFDLITGKPPFAAPNHKKTQEKIVRGKLAFPYFMSPDAKDLMTKLLRKEPQKRLGFEGKKDFAKIKQHRFFRAIDWKRLEKREMEPPIQPLITDPELAENFAPEFTDLALSPSLNSGYDVEMTAAEQADHPFRGFSFVAPRSFLQEEHMQILKEMGELEDEATE